MKELLRCRMIMVVQRISHILGLQFLLIKQNGNSIELDKLDRLRPGSAKRLFREEPYTAMGHAHIQMIILLRRQIRELEMGIPRTEKLPQEFRKLREIPGMTRPLMLVLMTETGNINRFVRVGNYVVYCGLGRIRGRRGRHRINPYLRAVYLEAAINLLRRSPEAQRWLKMQLKKRNYTLAIRMLAARLARICYFMIKDQRDFKAKELLR